MVANRRANREREILDVAARLFSERGYSATSVDDIAAEVGLNKAMLYYYFSSKAGILYQIFLATADDLADRLAGGDDDAPADEALASIVRAIFAAINTAPDYVTVFFQELHWLPKWLTADELEIVRAKQAEFVARVQGVVERGMAEGTFREVDAALAVSAIIGMAGWMYRTHGHSSRYSTAVLADTMVSLALRGLLTLPDGSPAKWPASRPRTARPAKTTRARSR